MLSCAKVLLALTIKASYVFRITEVREHENVDPATDANGHWIPSLIPGGIQRVNQGVSGILWMCNGTQLRAVEALPRGARPWKTFSLFFSGGYGFRVMAGDARNPPSHQGYHPLGFEHDDEDGNSSYLTHVMQQPTLRCHRADQGWTRMLLPNTYHGPLTNVQGQGGLKGELAIFLALLAFSMPPDQLPTYFGSLLQNGVWQSWTTRDGCTYFPSSCENCN